MFRDLVTGKVYSTPTGLDQRVTPLLSQNEDAFNAVYFTLLKFPVTLDYFHHYPSTRNRFFSKS